MIRLAFIIVTLSCFVSCKPDRPSEVEFNTNVQAMPESFRLEGMQGDEFKAIADNADHIDFIFYDLPLSINQDGNDNVVRDLALLSSTAATGVPVGCKPLARKIYLGKGEIITEADLYFQEGCYLQVFYDKDQRPIYGNLLTAQGAQYYGNMMMQVDEEKRKESERQMVEQGILPVDQ